MLSTILGLIIGLVLIFCYRLGLKDGKAVAQDKPITNPVKDTYKAAVEIKSMSKDKKTSDDFMTGLNNILNYDGSKPVPEKDVV